MVLADEFRDGNVPAIQDLLRVARRAYAALPETVGERYFRGDSGLRRGDVADLAAQRAAGGGAAGIHRFRGERADEPEAGVCPPE